MAGIFITRRDIEQRRPMYASDMLRSIPGVQLTGGGGGTRPRIVLNRSVGMRCSTQIFVDGMLLNRRSFGPGSDFRLDDVVSPGSIEGMEVYKGLSGIPPEFLTPDAECGVIAVWTRRGGSGGEGAERR
jgi:outer membrane receptor for ferrienterochelin and colicin